MSKRHGENHQDIYRWPACIMESGYLSRVER